MDEPNLWKQTVRDIFDELHLGQDNIFTDSEFASRIVAMIEERHSEYFRSSDGGTVRRSGRAGTFPIRVPSCDDLARTFHKRSVIFCDKKCAFLRGPDSLFQ
jgi:hypothetical protein